jgi:hypothetical protein
MKTTKEIINDELGVILNSVDYDVNNALFEINKNKKWYSEEEIKEAIKKVQNSNELFNDFEGDLLKELLGE